MRRYLITLCIILYLSPAFGQTNKLQQCINIINDESRLSCYDDIAKKKSDQPKQPTTPTADKGQWKVSESKSALTDQKTVTLHLESNEPISCRFGSAQKIGLVVRCLENKTVLYFTTHCHLSSSKYNDYGHVHYRIDSRSKKINRMQESTDHSALGLWSGGRSIPFSKKLMSGKKLVVRITPYSESPFEATFNIEGLSEAIKPLRKACSW